MLSICKYYSNNTRLLAGMKVFSEKQGFSFYVLSGSMLNNKGSWKITTPVVTVMVTCFSDATKQNLVGILTTDSRYKEYDSKKIDTNDIEHSDINMLLCENLRDKYQRTRNPFHIEFGCKNSTVTVTVEEINGVCDFRSTIHSVSGEFIVTGSNALARILKKYSSLRSFCYNSVTEDFDKTVSIRRNRGEILKEISKYLNRTLIFVSSLNDGQMIEQYISNTGVLEVITRADYSKAYRRVSAVSMKKTEPFCLCFSTATIESIAKEQGRLLRKG